METVTGIHEAQLNGILWALWGQSTSRLTWERPHGDRVTEQKERLWRVKALSPVSGTCPHWAAYRACAIPLVTEAAQQQFTDDPAEEALLKLFQVLQWQPTQGMPLICAVAKHADLDHIIEADVWPWLERESTAAQEIWQAKDYGVAPAAIAPAEPPPYREQIEPMAKIAYRYHELATQVGYLANPKPGHAAEAVLPALDEANVQALTSCAATLLQYCAYSRASAGRVRDSALLSDRWRQIGSAPPNDAADQYQWWMDITTREITSQVRGEVSGATTTAQIAAVLSQLADEADALSVELGDAFERVQWSRGIVGGTVLVGPELREVSERLSS